MDGLRVLLLDRNDSETEWRDHRFAGVAHALAEQGSEVTLAKAGAADGVVAANEPGSEVRHLELVPPDYPLVCGAGRALETAALRQALGVAYQLADREFDLVLAPLRGGLAHGLLMRRATDPDRPSPTIALWCDAPMRWMLLNEDDSPLDLGPAVADALERSCLRFADVLLAQHETAFDRARSLQEPLPPCRQAILPDFDLPSPQRRRGTSEPIEELVFVGPLTRANGALAFMDAAEQLAASGLLARRIVTFLGPASSSPRGIGQVLLGLRAGAWQFRFQVVETQDPARMLAYLSEPGRLAVFAGYDREDDRLLRTVLKAGGPVLATSGYDATRDGGGARHVIAPGAAPLFAALRASLEHGGETSSAPCGASDWPDLVRQILAVPRRSPAARTPPPRTASICILHRDRVASLRRALKSIGGACESAPAEVLVLDNASIVPTRADMLDPALTVRILRNDLPVAEQAAYNRFAAEATGDVLVFLDDDNAFAPAGVDRLLRAFQSGWFDVVVTTLDLVDGDPASDPSSGRFVFLGDPGTAGLFFNGFGDTAMAVAREAFRRIGGCSDLGHGGAAWDWLFLAKARAAGLRIGVLLDPAVRYERRLGQHHHQWRKNDAEGPRRAVLEAYGAALDAPLLARLAQGLKLHLS